MTLERIREALPAFANDIKLNLQTVMQSTALTPAQAWGSAVAAAAAARHPQLREATIAAAREQLGPEAEATIDDALAAATLMAMNNVYYRFRHKVGKESYSQKPPRLRMNRIGKVATSKVDFELYSLVVSAINDCEACVRSHEQVVTAHGLAEDAVHDAIRIAATFHAAALAAELPGPAPAHTQDAAA